MLVTTAKTTGKSVCIYLDGPLYSYFEREAKARKSTVPKVIKERLAAQQPTVFDQISDLLTHLGPGSNLGDLSTNSKHMEGFGGDVQPMKRRK